jgi:DNA-binding protein H-NS
MAKNIFDRMTVRELRSHIVAAQRALARRIDAEGRVLRREFEMRLADLDLRIDDLVRRRGESGRSSSNCTTLSGRRRKQERPKSKPLYANPKDQSQTWTGRGRPPGWAKKIQGGGNLGQASPAVALSKRR